MNKNTEIVLLSPDALKIKLFCDGANLENMAALAKNPLIKGFTTNPTLMRKAGITDYEAFGREVLRIIRNHPISLEVFADDLPEMERQARKIATWGANVNIKIPVTNTKRESTVPLIHKLSEEGIQVNVTAIMTLEQVRAVTQAIAPGTPAIISVFAGRIADTGRDPLPYMTEALKILKSRPMAELLWASPREVLNVYQADAIGCHIITVTPDILAKLDYMGKSLDDFSLETVKMFYKDALAAGYAI